MRKNSWIPHCAVSGSSTLRNQRGDFLVEAVIAVLVSSIISTAMVQMYTQTRRTVNGAQGTLVATALAQEILDSLRTIPFRTLRDTYSGSHTANLLTTSSDPLFPNPLLQDPTLNYSPTVVTNAKANPMTFHTVDANGAQTDQVTVNITQSNLAGVQGLQVSISMSWRDTGGKPKTYTLNSFLTPNGMGS